MIYPFSEEWKIMKDHFRFIKKDTPLLSKILYIPEKRKRIKNSDVYLERLGKRSFDYIEVHHYPSQIYRRDSMGFSDAEKYEFFILVETFREGLCSRGEMKPKELVSCIFLADRFIKEKYKHRFIKYGYTWMCDILSRKLFQED